MLGVKQGDIKYHFSSLWYDSKDKGIHAFPKCICPKVNVIVRLEFELDYYDFAVRRFNQKVFNQ